MDWGDVELLCRITVIVMGSFVLFSLVLLIAANWK